MNAMTAIKADCRASTAIQVFDAIPDAALLRLWREYVALLEDGERRIKGELTDSDCKALDRNCDRMAELAKQIMATPAVSALGLSIKAKVAFEWLDEGGEGTRKGLLGGAELTLDDVDDGRHLWVYQIARDAERLARPSLPLVDAAVIAAVEDDRAAMLALDDLPDGATPADEDAATDRIAAVSRRLDAMLAGPLPETVPAIAAALGYAFYMQAQSEGVEAIYPYLYPDRPDALDELNKPENAHWLAMYRLIGQLKTIGQPAPADPDDVLVELFARWKVAVNAYNDRPREMPGKSAEDDAAAEAYMAIERQMIATPARGARGLAVKAALYAICNVAGGYRGGDAAVFTLSADRDHPDEQMLSIVRDAQRFVPEVRMLADDLA